MQSSITTLASIAVIARSATKQRPLDVETTIAEMVMPFGKCEGTKIREVWKTDPKYMRWLMEQRDSEQSTDLLDRAIMLYYREPNGEDQDVDLRDLYDTYGDTPF
jgi:uncharacterized protein (DUF3820 family)